MKEITGKMEMVRIISVEMNEVKNLISEGKIEEATAKCDEIISSELFQQDAG